MFRDEQHLRIVGPEESIRRRRPGLAFVLVLVYAALFGGALWYLAARTGIWRKAAPNARAAPPVSAASTSMRGGRGDGRTGGRGDGRGDAGTGRRGESVISRDSLIAGDGVSETGKESYFSRLATERCDCGCSRTLSDCLINEKSCSRSPELAAKVRETVNSKR